MIVIIDTNFTDLHRRYSKVSPQKIIKFLRVHRIKILYRIEILKESGLCRTQVIKMPISARKRMAGVVKAIEKGEVASTVKIEISKPSVITAMITKEAVEELGLKEGDKVEAVIKATEVMVSTD